MVFYMKVHCVIIRKKTYTPNLLDSHCSWYNHSGWTEQQIRYKFIKEYFTRIIRITCTVKSKLHPKWHVRFVFSKENKYHNQYSSFFFYCYFFHIAYWYHCYLYFFFFYLHTKTKEQGEEERSKKRWSMASHNRVME